MQELPVYAAIDVGSNTIHLVVARCAPDDLEILADEVEMVRIGESVNATGMISPEKHHDALSLLRKYKTIAEQHRAGMVLVVATEAIRKAKNSAEFLDDIRKEVGLECQIISGAVEATLTFYGASYEALKEQGAPTTLGVMDLGGGSTELVVAAENHISTRLSVPIGSGWLHDRYLRTDPPTQDELAVALTFLDTYLQGLQLKPHPPMLIVTGGSANSLLFLARRAFRLGNGEVLLKRDDLVHCEGLLFALPARGIAQRYSQPLARARILPGGALIIRCAMDRFKLDEIRVSPHGIREGVLLAYARYGEHWLEQVQQSIDDGDAKRAQKKDADQPDEERFVDSARHALYERTQKLLDWRDEVLKNDDVEAVHKMRVATRRLRAALDAYQSACDRKQFAKVYRRVKKVADALGKARDTDVMIEHLRDQCTQLDEEGQIGTNWLIERLTAYREKRQHALERFFEKFDADALEHRVEECVHEEDDDGKG